MKARDYSATHAAIAGDIGTFIKNHPDNFEILLFKAINSSKETTAISADVVGSIESQERQIDYEEEPIIVTALKYPGGDPILISDTEDNPIAKLDQPITLLIDCPDIPVQSFFEINEYISLNHIKVNTYIIAEIENISEAPGSGKKYICTPFHDFAYAYIEDPEQISPADRAMGVGETPTLEAGPFAIHGHDDVHTASHWQVWESGETYEFPVFDSGITTEHLQSISIPTGNLQPGKTYFWHVKYYGAGEDPDHSDEPDDPSRFTTAEAF